MRLGRLLKRKGSGDISMTDKKHLTIFITTEEQIWVREIAKANKSSITLLIIRLLDQRSKELNIPLPTKRYKRKILRTPLHDHYSGRAIYMAKINEELGINE